MRKLLTIFFVGASSCLVADDFSVVQANLKRASEIRAETAEMQLQALREVENLNLLISSAKQHLKNLEAKVAEAKNTNKKFAEENSELSTEIGDYIQSIKNLSAFLDFFYAKMRAEVPLSAKEVFKVSIADFKTKSVSEKLRIVLNSLASLQNFENTLDVKNSKVATGLFVRLKGEYTQDVSILKKEECK